jgi:energy-coupling factor transporter ATP-binding protein EcfA2
MTSLFQLDHVQFAYSEKPVLDIEHLEISKKTVTALLGKNGTGKTTLLKLLSFLEKPQRGKIKFCSADTDSSSIFNLRKRVVMVTQKPYLLRGTVLDNVLLGLKFRSLPPVIAKKQAIQTLEQIGISYLQNKQAATLSGGEAQKVALTRALVLQPEALLLDEPFSHLDQDSIQHLSSLIQQYVQQKNRTIIFSTHNHQHAARIADETIRLDSGKCIELSSSQKQQK